MLSNIVRNISAGGTSSSASLALPAQAAHHIIRTYNTRGDCEHDGHKGTGNMSTDFSCDIPSVRNVYNQDEQVGKRDGEERKRGERREEIIIA